MRILQTLQRMMKWWSTYKINCFEGAKVNGWQEPLIFSSFWINLLAEKSVESNEKQKRQKSVLKTTKFYSEEDAYHPVEIIRKTMILAITLIYPTSKQTYVNNIFLFPLTKRKNCWCRILTALILSKKTKNKYKEASEVTVLNHA